MVQTIEFSRGCVPIDTSMGSDAADYFVAYLTQERIRQFSEADNASAMNVPAGLIDRYVLNAMRLASIEAMEDGRFYGEIPGVTGVWADGASESEVCSELDAALRAWLELKIKHNDGDIPRIAEIDLNVL